MFYFQDFRCTIRLCVDFEHLWYYSMNGSTIWFKRLVLALSKWSWIKGIHHQLNVQRAKISIFDLTLFLWSSTLGQPTSDVIAFRKIREWLCWKLRQFYCRFFCLFYTTNITKPVKMGLITEVKFLHLEWNCA